MARFFAARGRPHDLAIVRIVVFGMLFFLAFDPDPGRYARLPASLVEAPLWSAGPPQIGVSPGLTLLAQVVLAGASLLAVIGLWTRWSAPAAVAASVYFFGVPQMYAKVSHNRHFLVWLAAIVAVSRCADALSIDALRAARRDPVAAAARPRTSVAYALPIRLAWLLLGLVYFFPGYWKLRALGLDWASPEHMRTILYQNSLRNARPLSGLSRHPLLLRASGLGTLAFEVGFIVAVPFVWGRRIVAGVGLLFHNVTHIVMGISFLPLQVTYLILVNWTWLGRRVGRRRYGPPAEVRFVGGCATCCAAIASMRALDVLDQVVDGPGPGDAAVLHRAEVFVDGERCPPSELYRRVPMTHRQREQFDAAHHDHLAQGRPAPRARTQRPVAGVALVAAVVFAGVTASGFRGLTAAWPFASHPKFSQTGRRQPIRLVAQDNAGTKVDLRRAYPWMGNSHFSSLAIHIAKSPPANRAKMLEDIWADTAGRLLPEARSITFIKEQLALRQDGRAVLIGSEVILTIRR